MNSEDASDQSSSWKCDSDVHSRNRETSLSKTPKKRRGSIAVVLALACLCLPFVWTLSKREPYYNGKPFSYWLDRLPATYPTAGGGGTRSLNPALVYSFSYKTLPEANKAYEDLLHQQHEAEKAVKMIGGQCLPLLIRRLQSKDSKIKTEACRWAAKLHLLSASRIRTADMKRGQALTAIASQGYSAKPIFADLATLAHSNDSSISAAAKYALQVLTPEEFERLEKLQNANK